jgi:hypothetical protein
MKNSPSSVSAPVSQEEISQRAREIWLSRGSPVGQDVEIWLLAERELSPPLTTSGRRTGRKSRPSVAGKNADPEVIDVGAVEESLSRFGEPPQRSPTAVDLS